MSKILKGSVTNENTYDSDLSLPPFIRIPFILLVELYVMIRNGLVVGQSLVQHRLVFRITDTVGLKALQSILVDR